MTPVAQRPQDRLRLRPGASATQRVIDPRSTPLWTVLSLSLIGYFIWYFRAQRDCSRLLAPSCTARSSRPHAMAK